MDAAPASAPDFSVTYQSSRYPGRDGRHLGSAPLIASPRLVGGGFVAGQFAGVAWIAGAAWDAGAA